jgi:N-acetylneuraminic acid mutarotase
LPKEIEMRTCTTSCGFAALALAIITLTGCGGKSSSTTTTGGGGGGTTSTNAQWTWVSGSNAAVSTGSYGTLGTASASNQPPARLGGISWTDASGNFYLFGGEPTNSSTPSFLNDLWKYSPSTNQWTWVSGANTTNQAGNYGTLNTAASTNVPGARYNGASWKDTSGNLYLFGGLGLDKTGTAAVFLNDLWKYSVSSNQWTWVGGANTGGASNLTTPPGVYGTLGTAASANLPGVRSDALSWTDSSGNFWLFGGQGADSASTFGNLNDLWKYTPTTGQWTWSAGSNIVNQTATYGTLGTAAAANKPSARRNASGWIDSSNNLWLFGGNQGAGTSYTPMNDLWKYSTSTGQWTWVAGSNSPAAAGTYGTKGTAASGNTPGARAYTAAWTDSSNNLYLFGGASSIDSSGNVSLLNDLWKFSTSSGQWAWVSGSNTAATVGTYGTLGTSAATNVPGGRLESSSWIDSSGNLWLFGGVGFAATGNANTLNDLWKYQP